MSAIIKETSAIVLGSRNHAESDKIVTFYTQNHGKVTGIAKGANKSKKRFLNKLEQFSHITLSYTEKQHTSLIFVAETDLLSSFISLRTEIDKYCCGCFIIEILLVATIERETDTALFALLNWSLQALEEDKNNLAVCAVFLIRLFDCLGYCPDFSECRSCRNPFSTTEHYSFHNTAGGLVCGSCTASSSSSYSSISLGTIRLLRSVLDKPLGRLHRLHFSKQALNESLIILYRYGRNLFQRELKSWKTIRSLLQ